MSRRAYSGASAINEGLGARSSCPDISPLHCEFVPQATSRTDQVKERSPTTASKEAHMGKASRHAPGPTPASIGGTSAEVYVHGVGPGDQYKVRHVYQYPPFNEIREMCTRDISCPEVDTDPKAFSTHRQHFWPHCELGDVQGDSLAACRDTYEVVRATGLPNCMKARLPLPSGLNIEAWERYADMTGDEAQLIDFIKFGFPLGYMGPVSDTCNTPNHSSARDFPEQVSQFVGVEVRHGALVGPFLATPFAPWAHISPLMSREKSDGVSRRVISDLTFPKEHSVNDFIQKNGTLGEVRNHSLPTVADFVLDLKEVGVGAYMFTVDVARAYKNFRVDPLDWPLMCIRWEKGVYVETAMPFGARSSSCNMQRIANMIVRILSEAGVRARMYLDDLMVVAETEALAWEQYAKVKSLFTELGLPEAEDKVQVPATQVKWLGINICSESMCLSIPHEKLDDVLAEAERCRAKKNIHRRLYESLLGKLLHVAKCVVPARIFMSRMLQAYRNAKSWFVKVTPEVRADLDWFTEFCRQWNGRALIPLTEPDMSIQVDACLTGIGATDGRRAYTGSIDNGGEVDCKITELEAINVIVALHSFLSDAHRGSHVLVECDNLTAVQALRWGRARNHILAECARMSWMLQAILDVTVSFAHIAGVSNGVADALSRAHLSSTDFKKAENEVVSRGLTIVDPCLHALHTLNTNDISRRGARLAGGSGDRAAARVQGSGHQGQPRGCRQEAGSVLQAVPGGSGTANVRGRLHMDRIHGGSRGSAGYHQEYAVARARLRAAGWRHAGGPPTSEGHYGNRRSDEAQGLQVGRKRPSASVSPPTRPRQPAADPRTPGVEGGVPPHVLRGNEAVEGGAALGKQVRPGPPSHKSGHQGHGQGSNHAEMGKNLQRINQSRLITLQPTGDPETCPVRATKGALAIHHGFPPDSPFLLYPKTARPVSTAFLRAEWAAAVMRAGADHKQYSLHSLRKVSVTEAYAEGCSELEVQRHGGWASNAHWVYIDTARSTKVQTALGTAMKKK